MANLLNLGGLLGTGNGSGNNSGGTGLLGIVDGILPGNGGGLGGTLGGLLDPILGNTGGLDGLLDPVTGLVDGVTVILNPVTDVIEGVNGTVTPVLNGVLGQILAGNSAVGGLLNTVGGGAGDLLSGLGSALASTGSGLGDLLAGLGGNGGNGGSSTNVTIVNINGGTMLTGTPGNDFLQGGAGNDRLYGAGGDDILDGAGGFDIGIYQGNHTDYTLSSAGGAMTIKDSKASRDGTDTLRNMEFLQFKDGGIDLATNTFVSQAILNQSTTAYRGVVRLDAPAGVAETIGSGIAQGKFTFDAYVDALIKGVDHSTIPALIVAGLINGTVPTTEKLDALAAFAQQQYDYYSTVLGSASPELGPYEALGRGFASTSEFRSQYGGGTDSGFVSKAYLDVFGSSASSAQQTSLMSQINFFEALYKGAGLTQDQAVMQARGAVFGQIVGYAASDNNESYRDTAEVVLTGFANGDTSQYGAAFG